MPNIKDVAKIAGVSTATVSRVLNQPEKVLPKTAAVVREAIARLEYEADNNRRRYTYNNSHNVLVILPDYSNMFLIDVLSGINKEAAENDYSIMLFASNSSLERERETVKLLQKRQADGVIFLSSGLGDAELENIARSYPLVQCCEYSLTSQLSHVSVNNYEIVRDALEFLIKLGYNDIAMISADNHYSSTKLRERAFIETLQKHNLPYHHGRILRESCTYLGGFQGMQALMKSPTIPRAVLCNSDNIAAAAMHVILEAGLRVPDDIAVMGIDNLELCSIVTPALTTMAQPRAHIGRTAFNMFLRQIRGEADQQSIFVPHELIVRGST